MAYHQNIIPPTSALSDEQLARDWSLSKDDKHELSKYRREYRTFVALQICALRVYGRFLNSIANLSPQVGNYLKQQLNFPLTDPINVPERKATYTAHRQSILTYLNFRKFDTEAQQLFTQWLRQEALQGSLPDQLKGRAEHFLRQHHILIPGPSVLERLIISVCSSAHEQILKVFYQALPNELKTTIDQWLCLLPGEQRSYFHMLKAYPPAGKISSLKRYLERYETLKKAGVEQINEKLLDPALLSYLFKLTKQYDVYRINRFKDYKRYSLVACFLLETSKLLLDHLIKMHDQYLLEVCREAKNIHEKQHRKLRKQQKKAVETMLKMTKTLFEWPQEVIALETIWQQVDKNQLIASAEHLRAFHLLEEQGYGQVLLNRYASMRKYFAHFVNLPFCCQSGSEALMRGIELLRQLNTGQIITFPPETPIDFVPKSLLWSLHDASGKIQRNAWEMGLALAMKDALRSGDLYLPQSKHYVSFWKLVLDEAKWAEIKEETFKILDQPRQQQVRQRLMDAFIKTKEEAEKRLGQDGFAQIVQGKLILKRDDKTPVSNEVARLQSIIDTAMPAIRIEQLLIEVDQMTAFSRHFIPLQQHHSRPKNFYKTLIAAIISQATNLGIVAMSASVKEISLDMLRHTLHYYIREETLKAANEELVNAHHRLPLSTIHGQGRQSSSDAQRFKIRADSLLGAYYPRYYGYYEKAISIYTHLSDQYTVFSTQVIACSPREALYVLDGLLNNNTILKIREHTTDTHGYTELIFALCHLLGFYFMPRIKDLKDQQLYRPSAIDTQDLFSCLLNKKVDMTLIEEQWEKMIQVAASLKNQTAPAHVIVQRLTNSAPSDRLAKGFTHLGRLIKTQYILRYLTDPTLRRAVQLQLNKGEYRHKLPRWIFFANQGEFTTGDYEEIMNKASCLSLVSNAILYWNTVQIDKILSKMQEEGIKADPQLLAHISFLPFKHVLPNGTYFIEEEE